MESQFIPLQEIENAECAHQSPQLRLDTQAIEHFTAQLKALGHPVRLQMTDILSQGELCVCDIEKHFALTQPTISHHLKILRESGLIAAEQRGLWVYYSIQKGALAALNSLLANLTQEVSDVQR